MTDAAPPDPLNRPKWPESAPSAAEGWELELFKAQLEEIASRRKDFLEARHESRVAIESAQIEVIKGAVERSRDSAKQIGVAAGAIATLYTGLTGAVFSIEGGKALPLRGVTPVIFLGLAIVFSTAYISWLGPGLQGHPYPTDVDATSLRIRSVNWLNDLLSLGVLRRAWALRLATLALGAGLIFLPVAFLPVADDAPTESSSETATLPDFPPPPADGNRFALVRYQAEVKEIAAQRAKADEQTVEVESSGPTLDDGDVKIAFAVVLALILAYTLYSEKWGDLHRARKALEYREGDGTPSPPALPQ